MRHFLPLMLFLVTAPVHAQSTIESIPNQKIIKGSYVSNPDGILDANTVFQIDTTLLSLEKSTSVQVAVVVVESIGHADVFEFAQELFTTWGIGSKENDNGLLILFVSDQRTIRFHTGDGLEGVLPDVVCKRIQERDMVPAFKYGDYNAGMLAGIQEVAKIVTNPDFGEELKAPAEEISDWSAFLIFLSVFVAPVLLVVYVINAVNRRFRDLKNEEQTSYPEMRLKRWSWILGFAGIPVLIIVLFGVASPEDAIALCIVTLYLYYMLTLFHRLYRMKKVINRLLAGQRYQEIVEFLRMQQWYWLLMAVFFPFPFVFYFFYHLMRKRIYRNHPRNCQQCSGKMKKLSERREDEYLTESQQIEEKLGSVDYDVWKCAACTSVEFWCYLNRHSRYKACPECKAIAQHSVSRRTVTAATYSASGTGEEVRACKFCGHEQRSTYSIARLVHATSSPSSGSSFSSGSSGGGSWGGGSSGGGGASSRW